MTTPFDAAVARCRAGEGAAKLAAELVGQMTTEERLQVLDGDTELWPGLTDLATGGYHRHPWPASAVPRLGVPGFRFADGPRGVVVGRATCFPVPMARAATWDPALEERVGEAIGVEMRLAGADLFGGVCVNLLRHPGWGRAQETYGEDPLLVGEMGAALTRGVQRHVMACVKHFALNSMENARFRVDVAVDDRALHEVYLPHFRRVVDEGVAAVMSAYNSVNGSWCGESPALLTEILRDDWGFGGFVVSDFVFGLRDPVRSVEAGLDVELPFRQQRAAVLPGALEDGRLDRSAVSAAAWSVVATLLRFADRLVPADAPLPDRPVARPEHVALAREVAQRSIVLLRNEPVDGRRVLPLDVGRGRVAVVGPLADVANLGDRGSSDVLPPSVVTPLAGLRSALGDVVHDPGDDPEAAAALAAESDVAVVVVGCTYRDEGEFIDASTTQELSGLFPQGPLDPPLRVDDAGVARAEEPGEAAGFSSGGDRRSLQLSARDRGLVEAVAAASPRTVVVLMGGSAIVVDPWHDQVAAIVGLWYPGMAGGDALADVLTGAVEPTGRLPFAVPVDEADLVPFDPDAGSVTYDLWHGQWLLDRRGVAPRYPFGFGLSYTECVVERAELDVGDPADGRRLRVRAAVRNLGERPADEVVQVYAGLPRGSVERPARRLVAFGRVQAAAGRACGIELDVPVERLRVRVDGEWSVEEGTYELVVGLSAADPQSVVLEAEISCRRP